MSESNRERILVVDDEEDIARLVKFNLEQEGFSVVTAGTAADGLRLADETMPHVVVLDLMLPDLPGVEVCRRLRSHERLADVPILILSARGSEYDRVVGLELGADDYVVKPFSMREVVLRVRTLARRASEKRAVIAPTTAEAPRRLTWRNLEVYPERHKVFVDEKEARLRPLEFRLLVLFLENPGRVFTRQQLLELVWGIQVELNTRTVDTHVTRLRDRLGDHSEVLETVHGVGYRLREP